MAIVLDADSGVADTRSGYEKVVAEQGLPIERVFFIPNDTDSGKLEDLLEELVADEHRRILECFEEYEECLSTTNPEYATPDKKAKIYAYCEAVGDEPKGEKGRDYLNRSWWNLDAGELDPLRRFLTAL